MKQSDIFDRFSDNARRVLIQAQKIAQSMASPLDSQHLLLSLVTSPGTLAYDILKEYMVSSDQIKLVLSLRGIKINKAKGMTDNFGKILKTAVKIAADFNHFSIEPEHLLLSLTQNKDCVGYQILDQVGIEPAKIQSQIENIFQELSGFEEPQANPIEAEGFKIIEPTESKSMLEYFATDLTDLASKGTLDPVIDREKEITRCMQILCRRRKNNPVLIGEPGVGKTAIVEGLAQKITKKDVPLILQNKRVLTLDLTLLVAGTMYRGQFEDRVKKLIDEVVNAKNIILFIDEIHTIIGTGSAEGSLDAANILKPALAKGKIRLVGATTTDEYRKHIEKDAALERRLQPILVEEPTIEETIAILKGLKSNYEKHHHVKITDKALGAAAKLSSRYISDRYLPDKAIDLIDEASAASQLKPLASTGKELLEKKLERVRNDKEKQVGAENFPQAAILRQKELQLLKTLSTFNERQIQKTTVIDENDISRVVSVWTGIPLENLQVVEKNRFANLEAILKKYIIDQDLAIENIAKAIRRSKTGLSDPRRPIGSFMFLGPTGVGKSHLAKVLAREVYGKEESLVKIDMSEFMERHNVSRLVGAPPGYVGYEEAGKLTEAIRRQPYSVILLDEIEKAHPDVFNILLQILEDGYLTDAKGRKVNFRNCIIILTSNIGMKELNTKADIGFQIKNKKEEYSFQKEYEKIQNAVLEDVKKHFAPEFINRLDKIIVFKPLEKNAILQIVQLELDQFNKRLEEQGLQLSFDKKAIEFIAERGFDPENGARPVRRAIQDYLETPLSQKLLEGAFTLGDKIKTQVLKDEIIFTKEKPAQKSKRVEKLVKT